jgi:AcrR family transcriptional regulator
MPGTVRKVVRSLKRHFSARRQQQRTWSFYDAGERLLAVSDHEQMTVAKLCREAGSSIGTFYNRFGDKDRFLYFLISARFRAATDAAEHELRGPANRKTSTLDLARKIVEHIVSRMGGSRTMGVTRAALKLGSTEPKNLDPIAKYRTAVSDCAVRLLTPRLHVSKSELIIQTGVQVVFATLIDATLHKHGPLRVGEDSTTDALTDLMVRCLEIEPSQWPGRPVTPDQSASVADSTSENVAINGDEDNPTAGIDPDLRAQVGSLHPPDPRRRPHSRYRSISSKIRNEDSPLSAKVNPTRISIKCHPGSTRRRRVTCCRKPPASLDLMFALL